MTWTHKPSGRSVACSAEQLRQFRLARGWTQEQLAAESGFTPRLIAKGEGGGSLHPDTIEKLAVTLSTSTSQIHPEDLIFSPKSAVKTILEAYAQYERQCASKTQYLLDEEMTIWAPGDPEFLPFCGERTTIDGFDQFWHELFNTLQRPDKTMILNSACIVAEGNQVVVLTRERGSYRGSEADSEGMPIGFIFEFSKGKLVRFEDHFDTTTAISQIKEINQRKQSLRQSEGKA